MQLDFNHYAITLLVLGVAAGLLSLFIMYRLNDAVRWFALTLINGAIWAFFYGLELASLNLESIYFWIKFQYVGIVLLPITWLLFCFKYTGREKWLRNNGLILGLLLVAAATYGVLLSNDSHYLYYTSVGLHPEGPFPLIDIQKGPIHYLFTLYFYSIIGWGIYLLVMSMPRTEKLFRNQTLLLIISTAVPFLIHVVEFLGFNILGPINFTPFAFTISFFATGLGLIKYNLFAIVPIAKEQLIAAMTDGLMVIDTKEQIVEINPAMKKYLAGEAKDYIGKPLKEVMGHQRELLSQIKKHQHQKMAVTEMVESQERVFLVEMIPLTGRKDRHMGVLLLFTDITEERNNQLLLERQAKELQEHNALKDRLFSIVSHDLKGPILGVKEILDLSKRGYMTPDDIEEILPALSNSIDGVAMLLENLLAWSRSQLKGEFMDKVVFDIYQLIQQQKDWVEPVAALKSVRVDLDSEGSVMVFADKHMVELVIRNLLTNAVKFCNVGDRVSIKVVNRKEDVKISVRDTGVGISQDNLQRLRKGDSFTTFGSNNEAGTGLGLLLVRDYVKKNGSELRIDSQQNEWSEFSFALPKININ